VNRYLPVTVLVLALGVGMMLYPEYVEIHVADELVTLWTETRTTIGASGASQEFSFRTGRLSMGEEGFLPVLEITNSGEAVMNATVVDTLHPDAFAAPMDENGTELSYLLEETGSFDLEVEGSADSEGPVQVTATLFHFRHVPPQMLTVYPYRFFGYGMTAVGLLATALVYARGRREPQRM